MPATKADVFRSRALSGGDKRSLMRFLSACASAAQGQGHLKARFGQSSTAPSLQCMQRTYSRPSRRKRRRESQRVHLAMLSRGMSKGVATF